MDTNLLDIKFARIGARLKIADRPARRGRTSGVISLDVLADRRGEFFEIVRQPGAEAEIAVLDVQPADRHLLLLVREGKEKTKFLCGHDERHWFVAGIPESAPVGTVRQAKDLPECFAGWMARQQVQSGEIFEARTVQDKIDIAGDTTVNIPLFLDLQENQVVWSDIALKSRGPINNSRQAGERLVLMGKAITGLIKPNLYDLFDMHAEARGTGRCAESSRREADTEFSLHEGITPFDADRIMSEFMTNGTDQSETQGNVVYATDT